MLFHELKNPLKKAKKRVGRGGKRGTYSGKGQKGQRARSGHRIRPAERDLIMRIPKLRGAKQKPLSPKPFILKLSDLESLSKGGNEISREVLIEMGLIGKRTAVKILSDGEISKSLVIKGIALSKKAGEKILAAGGKIE